MGVARSRGRWDKRCVVTDDFELLLSYSFQPDGPVAWLERVMHDAYHGSEALDMQKGPARLPLPMHALLRPLSG
jgi:hypothetical protein